MKCRHCGSQLELPLVDLGSAPPSNAYLTEQTIKAPEKWFPLRVLVCEHCWLVQTEDFARREELFDADYAYFSGFSSTWLAHCKRYVADMAGRSRFYDLWMTDSAHHAAVGIAVSHRCDLMVAVAQGEGTAPGVQRAALEFLGSRAMAHWMTTAMGGS